ncbi:MAG: hypothetical protein HC922_04900 [Leptolyngbyaceae cyanobacterium SM2_3_12]|nr:hypothetical protein [Leptolyngbyaceae cyanobacterium SM2_3_12]
MLGHYYQAQFCPNEYGTVVADEWVRAGANRPGIQVDRWQVTPSSLESIVLLQSNSAIGIGSGCLSLLPGQKPWLLSSFVASFKAAAAKRINLWRNQPGQPVWQCGYQGQIIPNSTRLTQMRARLGQSVS